MINNTPESSKLDNKVKETLTNYEAPFDASDWSKMESMLDAAPKKSTFKWSTVIGVAAGVVIIGGCYLLYNSISSSKHEETPVVNSAPVEKVVKIVPKPIETPKVTPAAVNPAAVSEEVVKEIVEPDKVSKEPVNKTVLTEKAVTKENKNKTKKDQLKVVTSTEEINHSQQVVGMGNEPIFGDMLDSSRGIVGETREKEETKKAAKAKKDLPVGWDNFMLKNVNPDSLKKYRERRDSAKVK